MKSYFFASSSLARALSATVLVALTIQFVAPLMAFAETTRAPEAIATTTEPVVTETEPDETEATEANVATKSTKEAVATTTETDRQNDLIDIVEESDATVIATGDAVAHTDVTNVVNTNSTNSTVTVAIADGSADGDTDLRDVFDDVFSTKTAESTPPCHSSTCTEDSTITTENEAVIENNLELSADTGNNTIECTGDTAGGAIVTGDARASANLINVANLDAYNSNVLLLVINQLTTAGSLILPASSWFQGFFSQSTGGPVVQTTVNWADVENDIDTAANSGNNTAEAGSIYTGAATSRADIVNTINATYRNTDDFELFLRVHDGWSGEIFGLPEGLIVKRAPGGIIVTSNQNTTPDQPTAPETTPVSDHVSDIQKHETKSSSTVTNNIKLDANTGSNTADCDNSVIVTGDAMASLYAHNLINPTFIGSNWANVIVNTYDFWSGDIAFGQPDLWLGVRAEAPEGFAEPGAEIVYTYTIHNRGDSAAVDVRLINRFGEPGIAFSDTPNYLTDNQFPTWNLGTLPAGATREFSHQARVTSDLPRGNNIIPLTARVVGHQRDANEADNEDTVVVNARRVVSGGSSRTQPTPAAVVVIEKTANRQFAQPGDFIEYTVTFNNQGGHLYDAILADVLKDEEENILHEEFWELDEIQAGETITINYSIEFPSDTATGTYRNTAQLFGWHGHERETRRTIYESPQASHDLELGAPEGTVLGLSTCEPYLTTYLRHNYPNNSDEVRKLQEFLNEHTGANLVVTDIFNLETESAVRSFQRLYADEILTPWGLTRDSGYVYFTTQKKINEIMCAGTADFALTITQQQEINSYRALLRALVETKPKPIMPKKPNLPLVGLDTTPPKPEAVPVPDTPPTPPEPEVSRSPFSALTERIGNWFRSFIMDKALSMR